jgi:hypothetical protein
VALAFPRLEERKQKNLSLQPGASGDPALMLGGLRGPWRRTPSCIHRFCTFWKQWNFPFVNHKKDTTRKAQGMKSAW